MESPQDKGIPFSWEMWGTPHHLLETSTGGVLVGVWQETGGSGDLIGIRLPRQGDNDSFIPRSEEVGGSGFSVADWTGPTTSSEQQLPPSDGPVYSEGWGGKLSFYPEPTEVFEGSLGFVAGELSTGYSIPLSDLLETQFTDRPIVASEGFNSTQVFRHQTFWWKPSRLGIGNLGLQAGVDLIIPTDTTIEPKEGIPTRNSQKGEKSTKAQISAEGRQSKAVRCARERIGTE
jgi:hypothetical protein